jgi:signal transduction histidine kinase
MSRLNDAVSATIGRLRQLTFRMHPPEIDRVGLSKALSDYLAQFASQAGLTWELRHDLDREPPPEAAITIFRICQEALANVRKHAQAASVTVSLSSADHGVRVRVVDDGIGADPLYDGSARHEHFGLIEMRERAELAGGWWNIEGRSGEGTIVQFWLPMPPAGGPTERYLPR